MDSINEPQDHDFLVEVPTFEQFLDRYEFAASVHHPRLLVRLHQSPIRCGEGEMTTNLRL